MSDVVLTTCEDCNGYGARIVSSRHYHSRWDSEPPEYYNEELPCEMCAGTGRMIVEGKPITLEDLDCMCGDSIGAETSEASRSKADSTPLASWSKGQNTP